MARHQDRRPFLVQHAAILCVQLPRTCDECGSSTLWAFTAFHKRNSVSMIDMMVTVDGCNGGVGHAWACTDGACADVVVVSREYPDREIVLLTEMSNFATSERCR